MAAVGRERLEQAPSLQESVEELPELWRRSSRFLASYRREYTLGLAALILEISFGLAFPLGVKALVDRTLVGRDDAFVIEVLLGLALLFIVAGLAGVSRDHLCADVGARLLAKLRLDLFAQLQRKSVSFLRRTQIDELVSRFTEDATATEHGVTRSMPNAVRSGVRLTASVLLLLWLHLPLAALTIAALAASFAAPRLLRRRAVEAGCRVRTEEERVAHLTQESIGAQVTIRALGLEASALDQLQSRLEPLVDTRARAGFLSRLAGRASEASLAFGQIVVIGMGSFFLYIDSLTVGTLVGCIGLALNAAFALAELAYTLPEWRDASPAMKRVEELLDGRAETPADGANESLPRLANAIRLEDVTFSYTGEMVNLKRIDLTIRAGEKVAIVGRGGSGKTTLLGLLMRFYDPDLGKVSFDGVDLRAVSPDSIRAQMGVVFPETFLFNATIRENIRLGKTGARDEDVREAARLANLHDSVLSLPKGYDTVVGEKTTALTESQRQRLALARAILRDPAILILDEATAALDHTAELDLNRAVEKLATGRTVIWATPRLAAVRHYDRILVMDEGQLVEQGTHEELLAHGGVYFQLWQQQRGFTISLDGRRAGVEIERLRAIPLFSTVSEPLLAAVANRFITERFADRKTVFEHGTDGDKFYIIVRGSVEVVSESSDGEEHNVAVLGDGDFFGEMALLADGPRTATIRTRTPSLMVTLAREQFLNLLAAVPELRTAIEEIAESRRRDLAALR